MNNTTLKLSEIIKNYPVFEENQVLTKTHLNNVVQYLDQQQRLTRLNLLGYGIVCGLKVLKVPQNTITISKGCGITSEGYLLIHEGDMKYSNYVVFKDENAKYTFFKDIPLYELIPDNIKKPGETKQLRNFDPGNDGDLDDFAVVLYNESYIFDPDICTGGECDNKGKEQVNKLRVLLIEKSALDKINADQLSPSKKYYDLNNVYIERLKLVPENIDNYDAFADEYLNICTHAGKALSEELKNSYLILQSILSDFFNNTDPTAGWIDKLDAIIENAGSNKFGVQYVYDFFKDLVSTYNEFVESVFKLEVKCLPATATSPDHILIGDATGVVDDNIDKYRQAFVESPILNHKDKQLQNTVFLYRRIGKLINNFLNRSVAQIRITPSKDHSACLGEKAIPFYYKIDNKDPLNNHWDFYLHEKKKTSSIYSYNAENYNGTEVAKNPLNFNFDANDFFRIEGHLGKDFQKALEQINLIIKNYNLPIKVIPLQIEKDINLVRVIPGLKYYGMEILHKLYRDELISNMNDLKLFNVELNQNVQAADDEELPPVDIESNTLSFKSFTEQQTNLINTKINTVKTYLSKSIENFDGCNFENDYKEMVNNSAILNKGIKGVTFASAFTPLEKVVNNITFSKLKWINDSVRKREEKAKEKSIFDKFLEENPGLEHLGGVCKGGTFILVYSSSDNTVVADVSLHYHYYETPVQEVPEGSDTSDDNFVFDWKLNNDVLVYINPNKKFKEKAESLESKFDQLQQEVSVHATNLNTYQGSINTLIQTLPTFQPVTGLEYSNLDLAKNAQILKGMDSYAKSVRAKGDTATDAEIAILNETENLMAAVIENTIRIIAAKNTDIEAGSEEEKILNLAIANASKLTNDNAKNKVKTVANEVKNVSDIKPKLQNSLNKFIL